MTTIGLALREVVVASSGSNVTPMEKIEERRGRRGGNERYMSSLFLRGGGKVRTPSLSRLCRTGLIVAV